MTNILFRAVVELVASALKPKQLGADIRISYPAQFLQVADDIIYTSVWLIDHKTSSAQLWRQDKSMRRISSCIHCKHTEKRWIQFMGIQHKESIKAFLLYCQSSLWTGYLDSIKRDKAWRCCQHFQSFLTL